MGCSSTHSRRSCRPLRPDARSGRPRPAASAARHRWSRSPGQRCRRPVARPAGEIARPSVANRSRRSRTSCSPCFIRSRSGIANSAPIVAASPGVITPPASAEVTAFIAAAMSWAFSPRALSRGSTLDRRQGELDRTFAALRQNAFDAQPQRCRVPDQRQLDGLAVKASASPASNAAAAIIVLLRQPTRRPRGLPDRPFSNGRPRTRPGAFGAFDRSSISFGFDRRPCGRRRSMGYAI